MTNKNLKTGDRVHRDSREVRLVATAEAAAVLGVNPRTLTRWATAGLVPSYNARHRFMFDLEELLEALRTRAA